MYIMYVIVREHLQIELFALNIIMTLRGRRVWGVTLRRLIIVFHSDSWWYGSEECFGVCRALCRKQILGLY